MKIKSTLILAFALLLTIAAKAQVRYGVRAGLGLNKVSALSLPTGDYSFKNSLGPTAGLMATSPLNDWVDLQVEANYAMRGFKDEVYYGDELYDNKGSYTVRSSYLEVPVLVKVYPIKTLELNLQLGPQVGLLLDRSVSTSTEKIPAEFATGKDRTADAAIVFGLGYDNRRISVDARYNLGLLKTYKERPAHKNRGLSLTVGLYF